VRAGVGSPCAGATGGGVKPSPQVSRMRISYGVTRVRNPIAPEETDSPRNSFPLDSKRDLQPIVTRGAFSCAIHFYRQIYRHPRPVVGKSFPHLSVSIADSRQPDAARLSGSIEIYRFRRCSLAASTSPSAVGNGAKKVPISRDLTYCLVNFLCQLFYRHGTAPNPSTAQKTTRTAVHKSPNLLL
jgi:hypothetical protein